MNLNDPTRISTVDRLAACDCIRPAPAASLASVLRRSNVMEWESLNIEQEHRDRDNLRRGMAWAVLFSTIFWSAVACWVAL